MRCSLHTSFHYEQPLSGADGTARGLGSTRLRCFTVTSAFCPRSPHSDDFILWVKENGLPCLCLLSVGADAIGGADKRPLGGEDGT